MTVVVRACEPIGGNAEDIGEGCVGLPLPKDEPPFPSPSSGTVAEVDAFMLGVAGVAATLPMYHDLKHN